MVAIGRPHCAVRGAVPQIRQAEDQRAAFRLARWGSPAPTRRAGSAPSRQKMRTLFCESAPADQLNRPPRSAGRRSPPVALVAIQLKGRSGGAAAVARLLREFAPWIANVRPISSTSRGSGETRIDITRAARPLRAALCVSSVGRCAEGSYLVKGVLGLCLPPYRQDEQEASLKPEEVLHVGEHGTLRLVVRARLQPETSWRR